MNGQLQYNRGLTEPRLPRSALAVRVTAVMLLCFLGWAWYFQLDEVTTGIGQRQHLRFGVLGLQQER